MIKLVVDGVEIPELKYLDWGTDEEGYTAGVARYGICLPERLRAGARHEQLRVTLADDQTVLVIKNVEIMSEIGVYEDNELLMEIRWRGYAA